MDTNQKIKEKVESSRVVLFMKGNRDFPQCGFSGRAVQILQALGAEFETSDVLMDDEIRQGIKDYSNWPTIPQLYVDGEFIGGSDIMMEMYQNGELKKKLDGEATS
jgi:monothiol glutaredoxin